MQLPFLSRGLHTLGRLALRLAGKVVVRRIRRQVAAFDDATKEPRRAQDELLRRILAYHADTAFGRDHGFGTIRSAADFRSQVPVAGYEYVEPYIDRVRRGELQALLADRRIHMFALTSGTTASRKFIPVNDQYLADYRRGWNLWGIRGYWDHPEVKLQPIVQLSSDWEEFRTESGVPCGSVTGLTARTQKRIVRIIYCVPALTAKVKDPAAKLYLALRLSLPRPRVGMIIAANPSTLVNLARLGDQEKESLVRDLADGTLSPRCDVPADIRAALARRLRRRHRERARELEAVIARTGTLYPKDYWPNCLPCNWTGGSVAAYLRHYPRYFGDRPVRDVGLIASEGRMTIPVASNTASGVLDVTSHYFEFIPEEEGDSPQPTTLQAHELEEGRTYYILPTTAFGLYRYHIHDVVRVTGFYHGTPLIEFLSKGSHFANLTGEKVSEYHVTEAVAGSLRELDLTLTAYSLAPCWDDTLPYYGLFVERGDLAGAEQGRRLAESVERRLAAANIEYACKRETGRLGPVRLALLPVGAWGQWDRQRLARSGGTPEQYKHPCLISDLNFRQTVPVEQELVAG